MKKRIKCKTFQIKNMEAYNWCIMLASEKNTLSCVLIDLPMSLGAWQALISDPVSTRQCNPSFHHNKTHLQPGLVAIIFFQKPRAEKYSFLTLGSQGLLRYYFCWLLLCYSAAWWPSTRQCIISPMRAIIIRTVWMALYDVEMLSRCEGQLNGDFSKMNKYMEMFLHLHKNGHLLTFTSYWRR